MLHDSLTVPRIFDTHADRRARLRRDRSDVLRRVATGEALGMIAAAYNVTPELVAAVIGHRYSPPVRVDETSPAAPVAAVAAPPGPASAIPHRITREFVAEVYAQREETVRDAARKARARSIVVRSY